MTSPLLALTGGHIGDDVWRGPKEGFFMFYETFWALILERERRADASDVVRFLGLD